MLKRYERPFGDSYSSHPRGVKVSDQSYELLEVDILGSDDLPLQGFNRNRERSGVPDKDFSLSFNLACPPRSSARAIAISR